MGVTSEILKIYILCLTRKSSNINNLCIKFCNPSYIYKEVFIDCRGFLGQFFFDYYSKTNTISLWYINLCSASWVQYFQRIADPHPYALSAYTSDLVKCYMGVLLLNVTLPVMYLDHLRDRYTALGTKTTQFSFFQLYFNKNCTEVAINDFTIHLIILKWFKIQKCKQMRKIMRQRGWSKSRNCQWKCFHS